MVGSFLLPLIPSTLFCFLQHFLSNQKARRWRWNSPVLAKKAVAVEEVAEGESEGVERGTEKEERDERALKRRQFREVLR